MSNHKFWGVSSMHDYANPEKGAVPKKMVCGGIRFRTYFENPHGHEWGNLPSRCQFCGQGPFCNPHAWSNHNSEPQSRSLDSESMNCKIFQWALKLWAQADHEFDGVRKVALGEWPGPGDNTVVRNVALQLKTSSHIPRFGIVTQIFAWARAWPAPTEGSSIQSTPVLFKSAEAKIASMGVLAFLVSGRGQLDAAQSLKKIWRRAFIDIGVSIERNYPRGFPTNLKIEDNVRKTTHILIHGHSDSEQQP